MTEKSDRPRIGILTDTDPLSLLIRSGLDEDKYQVIEFKSDVERLLSEIQQASLDCLFLKTSLKAHDGLELCYKIKGDDVLRDIKIVFVSTDNGVAQQAIEYRANHFLQIPFKQADVIRAVNQLVNIQKTILYVDDSNIFHKSVVPQIKEAGYQVIQAYDGKQALEIVKGSTVDLVISDVEMPEMDGFTFCNEVKTNQTTKDIPVIITTTLDSTSSIEKGFAVGANDYLTKPFVIPELLNRIEQHLQKNSYKRPEKILVIDSDSLARSITLQTLRSNDFVPDEARNGRIACTKLRKQNYDLIITAMEMPVMDGYEFILHTRENPDTSDIPIIVLGQREKITEFIKVQSIGVQAFLATPFNTDRLAAEVERLLAQQRLNREREEMKHYLTDEAIAAVKRGAAGEKYQTKVDNAFRTIVFTDIAQFTPLCENMNAFEVVDMLNNYFDKMVETLINYGASIDKFIGDAIMAIFDKEEDGAHRAVAAGMAMIANLQELRENMGLPIKMRVGINSGHVILGDIGSRLYRRDFTVIGDNVNTAQRLESNSEIDGVLISQSTYDLLGDKVNASPRDLTLKGKKEVFRGYQVNSIKPYDLSDSK